VNQENANKKNDDQKNQPDDRLRSFKITRARIEKKTSLRVF